MEARQAGLGSFPLPWRSSLAISVYEPILDDLPAALCHDRITYLKVTCSITGWQPTAKDNDLLRQAYPDLPVDDLLRECFACYGVLLNVAVFVAVFRNLANPNVKQLTAVKLDFSREPARTALPYPDVHRGTAEYDYAPFGRRVRTRPGAGVPYNPYLFGGRRYDEQIAAYDFRARVYERGGAIPPARSGQCRRDESLHRTRQ